MASQPFLYPAAWPQYHQGQLQDVQHQNNAAQFRDPAHHSTSTESPNPPHTPRPPPITPQPTSGMAYSSAPLQLVSQYSSEYPQQNQAQQLFFPPPPSASGQGQATNQPVPIRRRPVSMASYPTATQPSHSFGIDHASRQQLKYYPPPQLKQPLPSNPNMRPASVSDISPGMPQSVQQQTQYHYDAPPPPRQPSPSNHNMRPASVSGLSPGMSQSVQQPIQYYYDTPPPPRQPSPSNHNMRPASVSGLSPGISQAVQQTTQYYYDAPPPPRQPSSSNPNMQPASVSGLSPGTTQAVQQPTQYHYDPPPPPRQPSPSHPTTQGYSVSGSFAATPQPAPLPTLQYYEFPPPARQPSPSNPVGLPASLSTTSSEGAHSGEEPIRSYYDPRPHSQRTQSAPQVYLPSIAQQFPEPSQPMSQDTSGSQYHPPPPHNLTYSTLHSYSELAQSNNSGSAPDAVHVPNPYLQQAIPGITIASPPTTERSLAQFELSSLKKLWNKEAAKGAFSKGKKLFGQFEKMVEPIMPLLAASDPEIAAAYALRQKMKVYKQQQNAATTAETDQSKIDATGASASAAKEVSHVESGGGGLENFAPLLAALVQASAQSESQKPGANTGLNNNNLEALLLLLQQNGAQSTITTAPTVLPAANEKVSSAPAQLVPTSVSPAQVTTIQPQVATPPETPAALLAASTIPPLAQVSNPAEPPAAQGVAPTVPPTVRVKTLEAPPPVAQPEKQIQNENQNVTFESLLSAFLLSAAMQSAQNQAGSSNISSHLTTAAVAAVAPPETSSWVHHRAQVFGLGDILVPENHNLAMINETKLAGEIPSFNAFFQFELLFNDLQVQNKVKRISALTTNTDLTLVGSLSNKNFGIDAKVSMEGVLQPSEPGDNGERRIIYGVILQSPYGHGTFFSINAPFASLSVAKAHGATILASITWLDRRTICSDISTSISGSYRYYYSYSSSLGGVGSIRETREYTLATNGRYAYDRECIVGCTVTDNYGNTLVDGSAYNPDHVQGVWDAIEYNEDAGGCRFLILTEDNWDVSVFQLQGGGGPLLLNGKKYHKVS